MHIPKLSRQIQHIFRLCKQNTGVEFHHQILQNLFFQAEPGMFSVSLSRQYKIKFLLFSQLLPWLHDAVFIKTLRSSSNQYLSLVVL